MKKLTIFDSASVLRDMFGDFVKKNEMERKHELGEAKKIYRPGPELTRRLAEINIRHDEAREKRRNALLKDFDETSGGYNDCVSDVKRKVEKVDAGLMQLRYLDDFVVTPAEWEILVEKHSGSYWADRMLKLMAEKSGIVVDANLFDPDADAVMGVLSDLRKRVTDFLDSAGSDSYKELDALHPAQLQKLENKLMSGSDPGYSPKKQAGRLLGEVASTQDVFSQSQKIRNILETCPEDVKKHFLIGLESGQRHILDDAIRASGADRLIDMKNKTHVSNVKKAREAVDKLRELDPGNWYEAARILTAAGGASNAELYDAVTTAFGTDNASLNDVLEGLEIRPQTTVSDAAPK